jgi:hypothetical protein
MQRFTSIAFRTCFFFAFLIILPILALPKVSSLIDKYFYDDKPTVVQAPVIEMQGQQVVEPQFADRVSPARFEESLIEDPSATLPPSGGLDTLSSAPPLMSPLPAFAAGNNSYPAEQPPANPLDGATEQRLLQVQERLQTLGAKYMILEAVTGVGYRFHCEMIVDPQATHTQNFDVTSPNPLEAAETVLRQVEGWRTAASPTGIRAQ